ncbi:MAG TPA: energy transducer TonB [Allosphingosinicella sp.]|jgi:TonB family protein
MARLIFLSALLIGAAAPALAGSSDKAARDAVNGEVLLSQYPPRALAAGEQGSVGFKVTLDRDGYASACEVTHSSGHKSLDQETCELILSRAAFKGIKDGGGRKVSSVHEGVVNWRLPGSTAAPSPTWASAGLGKPKPEKKICRRRVKTGSLANYERLCATQADWDRMAQRTKEEWGAVQGAFGSTRGN